VVFKNPDFELLFGEKRSKSDLRYKIMTGTVPKADTETWFDNVIATLRMHQVQLETNTAQTEVKKFYELMISSNENELVHLSKTIAQKHFVSRIVFDYLNQISTSMPLKLAFDYNDSEVLVWAEVADGDFEIEKKLLKVEAIINSKYHSFGFDMETTIVESGDSIPVPNHYKPYKS
jgi:hypothetical protein